MKALRAIAAVLAATVAIPACAATYLNIGGVTWHDRPGLNGFNPGIGIEHDLTERDFLAAGVYDNSWRHSSRYAVDGVRLWVKDQFSAGLFAGVADGYRRRNNGRFDWMGGPFVQVNGKYGGINLIAIPPAVKDGALAIAVQFKWKIR